MYFFLSSAAVLTVEGEKVREANDQTDKHLCKEEEAISGQKYSLLLWGKQAIVRG